MVTCIWSRIYVYIRERDIGVYTLYMGRDLYEVTYIGSRVFGHVCVFTCMWSRIYVYIRERDTGVYTLYMTGNVYTVTYIGSRVYGHIYMVTCIWSRIYVYIRERDIGVCTLYMTGHVYRATYTWPYTRDHHVPMVTCLSRIYTYICDHGHIYTCMYGRWSHIYVYIRERDVGVCDCCDTVTDVSAEDTRKHTHTNTYIRACVCLYRERYRCFV